MIYVPLKNVCVSKVGVMRKHPILSIAPIGLILSQNVINCLGFKGKNRGKPSRKTRCTKISFFEYCLKCLITHFELMRKNKFHSIFKPTGILILNKVPSPTSDSTSHVPPISSICVLTICIPMPRPDVSVGLLNVVKPG